jgi:hypothetical protein
MAVYSVLIGLQASRKDSLGVTSAEFLAPLNIKSGEVEGTRADGGAWTSGMIHLAIIRLSDFDHIDCTVDGGAQSEAFFAAIVEAFRAAGQFLDRRPAEVTTFMRASGLSLHLFVDVRMDQDQMELQFPPELLAACGRHSIDVYVISNDISAAEVLAARQIE